METIFISALPFKVTEIELKNYFERFGKVESLELFADWQDASFEPHARVVLDGDVDRAVESLDGKIVGSTYLRVNREQRLI